MVNINKKREQALFYLVIALAVVPTARAFKGFFEFYSIIFFLVSILFFATPVFIDRKQLKVRGLVI